MSRRLFESPAWVVGFIMVAGLTVGCRDDRTWDATPGVKMNRPQAGTLEGTWRGGDWHELVVTRVRRDSIVGRTEGGIAVRGSLSGQRADVVVSGVDAYVSGYLYVAPRNDSLFVGLRDSSGQWVRFFAMHHEVSPQQRTR